LDATAVPESVNRVTLCFYAVFNGERLQLGRHGARIRHSSGEFRLQFGEKHEVGFKA
jgi:hypothetical protein